MMNQPGRSGRRSMAAWLPSLLLLGLLSACGGGGGDGGGGGGGGGVPPPVTGFTLSGSIAVVDTSAVDSDLNDPNQTGYQLNHDPANTQVPDPARAQAISTPVLLTGTVNQPGSGPAGNNFLAGDTDDYFKVDLAAGQVVEVEFAADTTNNDIDLYVFDAAVQEAGHSIGVDTHFECVTVSRSGTYYVNVFAFSGASIYSLRIGAPGTGSSCANATAALGTQVLLAREHEADAPRALSASRATAHRAQLARAGVVAEAAVGLGPQRLRLPVAESARRAGLDSLRSKGATTAVTRAATVTPATPQRSAAQVSGAAAAHQPTDAAATRMATLASTLRYAKALRSTGAYAYVEPDWIMRPTAILGSFPPDDRYYVYQRWHYEQIQLPAAINRLNALAAPPSVRPVVAVIDSGVVLDHPDIAPQLFSNGRSFVNGVSQPSGDSQETSAGSVFHGTHVAGTVAASTFDGNGVAGVAPMARLLPLNVFGANEGANTSDIADAILYAARLSNGSGALPVRAADVINMSLGSAGSCNPVFQEAVNRARAAGVIVVAAAGNDGQPAVGQPANCAGVIAVSATQADRALAPYSNNGSALKVAAPGGNVALSTTGTGQPDGVVSSIATITAGGARLPSVGLLQGTSMASPHVAGVMALMRYVNPALTPAQVDGLLADIVDDLGTPGFDTRYGHGLINADKAVVAALRSLGGAVPPPPSGRVVAEPASLDFGSVQSAATLTLLYNGSSLERVLGVTSSHPAVTVTPQTVDASTGLGSYTISVNRSSPSLSASTTFVTLTVAITPSRSLQVPVVVTRASTTPRSGGFGPVYVLLTNASTGDLLQQVRATPTATGYSWTASGVAAGSVVGIIAGTDQDNDDFICQRGEACGAYPVLEAILAGQGLTVTGNRSGLDFQIAPISGISALSTANPAARPGFRRHAVGGP